MSISNNILISVVLPTYNHGRFISKAIQSILNQKYQNFEIIVIDNNSTDNTRENVLAFKDHRIKYFLIENEGIIARSRNKGIIHSKGDWISFLDSDDYWYPDKLSKVIDLITLGHFADVFVHNEYLHYLKSGKKKLINCGPFTKNFYLDMLIYGNRVSTSAVVVKKEFLINNHLRFNESREFISVEDFDLWLKFAYCNAIFYFIKSPLGEYSIHDSNNSLQISRSIQNLKNLLHHHVFNFQTIVADKDELWRRVSVKIDLLNIRHSISSLRIITSTKLIFYLFYNLKNVINYLKYKISS